MTEATQVVALDNLSIPPAMLSHAAQLVEVANQAKIETETDLANSADVVKQIDAHLKAIEAEKDKIAGPIRQGLDALYARVRSARTPLENAKTYLKTVQGAYLRKVKEEQEAEQKRLKDEQDRIAMEEAAAQEAEAKRLADEARAAQEAGDAAKAAELAQQAQEQQRAAASTLEQAAEAPPPSLPPAPTGARGSYGSVSTRVEWKAEITSLSLLIPSIINNAKMQEAAEKVVASMVKSGTRELPGVRIYKVNVAVNR